VLESRDELDGRVSELARAYEGRDVPRPDHWGGYRLVPEAYEFWQHRDDRMHDRFRYERDAGGWTLQRLSP
jgi:pyridoxamine 5'-phosphate oxidase